jgi:hypothetical protein
MDAAQTISHAWLWTPSAGMTDLNNLVDPSGAGWVLQAGLVTNNAGQIAAFGANPAGATHAVLLTLVGDMNGDGYVDGNDIAGFVLALTDPNAYLAAYPNMTLQDMTIRGDINDDGYVDGNDIASFVDLLVNGSASPAAGPAAAVPEPSSFLLLAMGAAGFLVWARRQKPNP